MFNVPLPGFGVRGADIDSRGVVWVSLASGDFTIKFLAALVLLVPYRILLGRLMPMQPVQA